MDTLDYCFLCGVQNVSHLQLYRGIPIGLCTQHHAWVEGWVWARYARQPWYLNGLRRCATMV